MFSISDTLISLTLFTVAFGCVPVAAQPAPTIELGPKGRLIYRPYTPQGDTILDFSDAGYGGGGVALPLVEVKRTLSPLATPQDDLPRLQKAVDELAKLPLDANGFRGALLLKRGVYPLSDTLKITSSGIVVRGEGNDEHGTVLLGISRKIYPLISILGGAIRDLPATTQKITNSYVPVGARMLNVTDATVFKVGDTVSVTRVGNAAWIHEIKMDQIARRNASTRQWSPFSLIFDRVVNKIEGNTLTLDAPLPNSIDEKWGGGSVAKYDGSARISNVGIENLLGNCEFDPTVIKTYGSQSVNVDENHANLLLNIDHARNFWARDLVARHLTDTIVTGRDVVHGTIQDCASLEPISLIVGGRRAPFSCSGQLTLWQRLRADQSRHAFVFGSRACGPNVFLDGVASNENGASEAHQRWAVGGLYDNIKGRLNVMDRGNMGSGQGWGGANFVVWNSTGNLRLQSPPTSENFAIGYVGLKSKPSFGETSGVWISFGHHVEPRSLYLQQLQERLGPQAIKNIASENLR